MPDSLRDARQVLLVVVDGLGWEQLRARAARLPVLASLDGSFVHTVAPSTTATALTSITTGLTPGEHGVVGYRMMVTDERADRQVLNVLRWSTGRGDARRAVPPIDVQPIAPFLGMRPPVITKGEFAGSGFSGAHLDGARLHGWRMASTLLVEARRLLEAGEPFVYAYYDGVDKVAHEYGLGEHYDAELAAADRLIGDLIAVLPSGAALLVTADHGQVEVGKQGNRPIDPGVLEHCAQLSGEGRFRWLHARRNRLDDLVTAATEAHGDEAWVVTVDQMVDDNWFGPRVEDAARGRLGDVALVAREPVSFDDPADSGPFELIGRHGSLTSAEMRVPLLGYHRA
ncbi:MAG: alkaline phosphatase family protein [Acidimicrobiia bacterium]